MNYETFLILQAKGARWGDLECLDYEDIIVDLQKRHDEIQAAKARRLVSIAEMNKRRERESARIIKASVEVPISTYVRKPFKRDFSKKKCCLGCKKFAIHSNPPAHFTETDKLHCCAYCNVTNGKGHGGSCQKNWL